jgi:hypothetical protein
MGEPEAKPPTRERNIRSTLRWVQQFRWPSAILNQAIHAVPVVRFALALAGIAAAAAIIRGLLPGFSISEMLPLFLAALAFMAALLLLDRVAKLPRSSSRGLEPVFLWAICLSVITLMAASISAITIGWPSQLTRTLLGTGTAPVLTAQCQDVAASYTITPQIWDARMSSNDLNRGDHLQFCVGRTIRIENKTLRRISLGIAPTESAIHSTERLGTVDPGHSIDVALDYDPDAYVIGDAEFQRGFFELYVQDCRRLIQPGNTSSSVTPSQ